MFVNNILTGFGLSSREVNVYLACLELGQAGVQEIAKKAKIKRTTAYSVLDSLIKRGFVIKLSEEAGNNFIAENPRVITNQYAEYQAALESKLPELVAIYNRKKVKPRVMFFEGSEGIKKILTDTINEKPPVILEFNSSAVFQSLPGFGKEYPNMRHKNNIRARRIAPSDKYWKTHKDKDAEEISETRLLPTDIYNLPVEINVYNNKVAFMSYADEFGLIIESKDIADSMRIIYNLFWDKVAGGKKQN